MADNNVNPNPQDTAASTQMFRAFVNEPEARQGAAQPQQQAKGRGGLYAVIAIVAVVVIAAAVYFAMS